MGLVWASNSIWKIKELSKVKGVLMEIDFHLKAVDLLEKIANSVHERYPNNPNFLCFSTTDLLLVKQWLMDFIDEQKSLLDG